MARASTGPQRGRRGRHTRAERRARNGQTDNGTHVSGATVRCGELKETRPRGAGALLSRSQVLGGGRGVMRAFPCRWRGASGSAAAAAGGAVGGRARARGGVAARVARGAGAGARQCGARRWPPRPAPPRAGSLRRARARGAPCSGEKAAQDAWRMHAPRLLVRARKGGKGAGRQRGSRRVRGGRPRRFPAPPIGVGTVAVGAIRARRKLVGSYSATMRAPPLPPGGGAGEGEEGC